MSPSSIECTGADRPGHPVVADRWRPCWPGPWSGWRRSAAPRWWWPPEGAAARTRPASAARSAVGRGRPAAARGPPTAGRCSGRRATRRRSPPRPRRPRSRRVQPQLGVPEAALEPAAHRPGPGADAARSPGGRPRPRPSARAPNSAVGRWPKAPPRPRSKITAAGTIGTTWPGSGPTGKPMPCRFQSRHHPVGRRQPVRAAAGQHHGVHPLDHVPRVQQVGLPGARAAAAYVHPADRARRGPAPRSSRSASPSPSAVWCPISNPSIIPPLSGQPSSSTSAVRPSGWHR